MKSFLKNKISLLIIFIAFSFFAFLGIKAGDGHNVSDWAWSENIGWISFNSTTDSSSINYGVNIDDSTGEFSGYAWSENIGWISFNRDDTGVPPTSPYNGSEIFIAKFDFGTKEVSGWARALGAQDGWDGWISLRGATPDYGVSYNDLSDELEGWAWSGDIGWISFNSINCDTDDNGFSDGGAGCPAVGTLISDYYVSYAGSVIPDKPSALAEAINSCSGGLPQVNDYTKIILNWSYSHPQGDSQDAYEIWLDDDDDNFSGSMFNLLVGNDSEAYTINLNDDDDEPNDWLSALVWGNAYEWKVRVKDNQGNQSEWSDPKVFTMNAHANPYPNFQPFPQNPSVDELVEFIQDDPGVAQALCYIGGTEGLCEEEDQVTYGWDFDYDSGEDDDFKGNATTTYSVKASYTVMLRITDITLPGGNNFCEIGKSVNLSEPLPEWREVTP